MNATLALSISVILLAVNGVILLHKINQLNRRISILQNEYLGNQLFVFKQLLEIKKFLERLENF